MKNLKSKMGFFGSVFAPSSQPGFQARYSGRVQDTQLGKINTTPDSISLSGFAKNPFKEFNSRQVKEVNPGAWRYYKKTGA